MKTNNLNHIQFFPKECDIFSGRVLARLHRRACPTVQAGDILLQSLSVFAAFAYFFLCLPVQESYFRAGMLCVKHFNDITFTYLYIGIWNFIFVISYTIISALGCLSKALIRPHPLPRSSRKWTSGAHGERSLLYI